MKKVEKKVKTNRGNQALCKFATVTFVLSYPDDREALTPNNFLLGALSGEIRFGRCDAQTLDVQTAPYSNVFWRRWLKEFLPALNALEKWYTSNELLKIGDVILVLEENIMRNHWKKKSLLITSRDRRRNTSSETANGTLIIQLEK